MTVALLPEGALVPHQAVAAGLAALRLLDDVPAGRAWESKRAMIDAGAWPSRQAASDVAWAMPEGASVATAVIVGSDGTWPRVPQQFVGAALALARNAALGLPVNVFRRGPGGAIRFVGASPVPPTAAVRAVADWAPGVSHDSLEAAAERV